MDTQDTGTSTDETLLGDSFTGSTDETVTDDTSAAGATEDADTLRKQLSDKDRYIKQLEAERLEKTSKKKAADETPDDVITWATTHADDLRMVGSEYQEELDFYKSHKIPVTNEIRERALRDAKAKKGLIKQKNAEEHRQIATSSETGTEMRKVERKKEIPAGVKQHAPSLTQEEFEKYSAEFEARGKKR